MSVESGELRMFTVQRRDRKTGKRIKYKVMRSKYYTEPHRMRNRECFCGNCNKLSELYKQNMRCRYHHDANYDRLSVNQDPRKKKKGVV